MLCTVPTPGKNNLGSFSLGSNIWRASTLNRDPQSSRILLNQFLPRMAGLPRTSTTIILAVACCSTYLTGTFASPFTLRLPPLYVFNVAVLACAGHRTYTAHIHRWVLLSLWLLCPPPLVSHCQCDLDSAVSRLSKHHTDRIFINLMSGLWLAFRCGTYGCSVILELILLRPILLMCLCTLQKRHF